MAFIGTVKVFKVEQGFGFLHTPDGQDVFYHVKSCTDGKLPQLGDTLKFDLEDSKIKPGQKQACNISGGSGEPMQAGPNMGASRGPHNASHVPTGAFSGTMKSYVPQKGYGFIVGPDGSDVFAHCKAVVDGSTMKQGDIITYDIEPSKANDGKMVACNIAGGTGWPYDNRDPKGTGKNGKPPTAADSWGDGCASWGDSWGPAKGDDWGSGKDGPYGKGKGKMMSLMNSMMWSPWGDGWGDGGKGWGGNGKGDCWGGKGDSWGDCWGGDGKGASWNGAAKGDAWGGDGCKGGKFGGECGKGDNWGGECGKGVVFS